MAKKAAVTAEAAPKYKQPWLGFLTFGTVLMVAYIVYQWFLHPIWGLATRMFEMNFFIAVNTLGEELGMLLAINNPMLMELYPLGYLVDWIPFFIFCIVWVFTIAYLGLWVPITPLKRQPWAGLGVLATSAILAFITWYIFGIVLGFKGYEMILLGTCGFLIFPLWLTLFNYWPLATPTRMGWNPAIKIAFYASISWAITLILYWVITSLIWLNPLATAWTQYIMGIPLLNLLPFEPYDFYVSLILSIIVGAVIMSIINPWLGIKQPKRGLLLFALAIIIGFVMWFIVVAILGPTSQTILITGPPPWLFTFPTVSHASVAAYVAFPLVTLLAGQIAFQMWPWNRWGTKGNIGLVITSFVVGTIVYYLFMVNPGFAIPLMQGNLITALSGLETTYLALWAQWYLLGIPAALWQSMVFFAYFEGLAEFVGHALMFAWLLTVVLFGLLTYETFHHWPWR
ncbi:MAG: hypothetical protein ACUVXA_05475 [Candidatus Jordarchaeum sp.]|uniref:hypothetical protein n=1 Tax=Candidatus Jordarchaeum sp. TaxID=2823881 RepID=UPI00404AF3A6